MSARSEELESLREGEPADDAAAPDEAALLDAGDVAEGTDGAEADAEAEAEAEAEVAAHSADTTATKPTAADATAADATSAAAVTTADEKPDDPTAADAVTAMDKKSDDAKAQTIVLPIYTEKPEHTADKAEATAAPAPTKGDIRRRAASTAKTEAPRKRDHGLPIYVEPSAETTPDTSAASTAAVSAAPAAGAEAAAPAAGTGSAASAPGTDPADDRPRRNRYDRSDDAAAAESPRSPTAKPEPAATAAGTDPAADDRPRRSRYDRSDDAASPASAAPAASAESPEANPEPPIPRRTAAPSPSATPKPPTAAMAAEAAAVAASGVAQDVADETARAVAEAAGDSDRDSNGDRDHHGHGHGTAKRTATGAADASAAKTTATSSPGADTADHEPDFSSSAAPPKRDRHTFLYGRGRRVLPWRHKSRLGAPQRRRRKIVVRSIWACVVVCLATVGWSVGKALTAPGTDTIQVRLAEWGRDHGLGGVVSTLEQWQYDLDPPKKGGTVDQSQFADLGPTSEPVKPSPTKGKPGGGTAQQPAGYIPMRPALLAPAGLTLEPGEGVFHPAVSTPDNQPVIQLARIRPDSVYTSVTEDVLWIDQKHTRYVLHPGHEGGVNQRVPVPNQIDPAARPDLIALFNGGFKISESHGGYFDHGVTVAPLVDGAASEVIFGDGHMSVGMWGRDFSFTKNPGIVTVRQNLKLMVDDGKVVPYIDDAANWGRSDHGSAAVWRSGVGVTAAGDIVYVAGNDLTAPALADLLQRAGALHAMQLDINLRWADFQYFPDRDGNPDTSKLYGDFLQGPTKFFYDSTKDFMAVYLR